jgi:hypothetical protein
MTNLARQPGVCPKRHAGATGHRHQTQKLAASCKNRADRLKEPPLSTDEALILLRLREDGFFGFRALLGRRFAGQTFLGDLIQDANSVATFVPDA